MAAARNGQDPAAERDGGRKAITIKELAERFDKEHIAIRVKASTGKEYRRNLQRFILPALGQLTVTGVTRADVAKFHHDLRHIPYQANRCLEVVSKMFSLSEMWGLRPDGSNPRKHIRKYPEEKRERFLSAAELRRIGEVLRERCAHPINFARRNTDATVKRFHYDSHDQLRTHLADFKAAYYFARRLKTLGGLTPYEYIYKIWTSEPDRFILDPIHQMLGLNT